jgi:hypothetical protein
MRRTEYLGQNDLRQLNVPAAPDSLKAARAIIFSNAGWRKVFTVTSDRLSCALIIGECA